jgi:hypothetical protein
MRILSIFLLLTSVAPVLSAQVSIPAATAISQGVVQPGKTMSIQNGILDCTTVTVK